MSDNQDWQGVLGIADPAPGDPSSIQSLSDAYSTVAANASQANNLLAQVQAAGTGRAMTAFNSQLGALPGHIQTLNNSYQEAAAALGAYAPALSAAQDQANQAWAQAGLDADNPTQLLGMPVVHSDWMPADGVANNMPLIVGDLSHYIIGQRTQITSVILRERFADSDQLGIILFERVGGGAYNFDAFRGGIV